MRMGTPGEPPFVYMYVARIVSKFCAAHGLCVENRVQKSVFLVAAVTLQQ